MALMRNIFLQLVFLLICCALACTHAATNSSVDVICTDSHPSSCRIVPSKWSAGTSASQGQLASAWFSDSYNETGWAHLEIATFQSEHILSADIDSLQAYAAGLAEGYLTGVKVSQHSTNTFASYWGKGHPPQPFVDYIETNVVYMRKQSELLGQSDPFWKQVGLILMQMKGLLDGSNIILNETNIQELTFFDIMISNIGDVCTTDTAPNAVARSEFEPLTMHLQMLKSETYFLLSCHTMVILWFLASWT
jgi:hypothetical protein